MASIDALVVGASAGGIDGLLQILPALPARAPIAVFVVMHLRPDQGSLLAQIFGARCALEVKEATDKESVAPGTIYFAPPNYHLLLDRRSSDGLPMLSLSADDPVHFSRPSVDVLFESAADLYGDRLMGLILSGANEDGAAGLLAIRAAGGLTAVQDPATSALRTMPESAVRVGGAEYVLQPRELRELILASLRPPPSAGGGPY